MKDAGPAVDMATFAHLGCGGREETDGAGGEVIAGHPQVDLLYVGPVHHGVWVQGLETVVLVSSHHKLTVGLQIVGVVILGSHNLWLSLVISLACLMTSLMAPGVVMTSSSPVVILEVEQMIVVLLPAARSED